jgi:anhydro-N-acetylmuramic acid kinase
MRIAGVMSGTSLDGIDVAVVDVGQRPPSGHGLPKLETVGFETTPYPAALRSAILAANTAARISRLHFHLAELYAKAVLRAVSRCGPVELIGCHGQTVYHEGGHHTLQLGEPAVLAERTGVPVVSGFRARDIAAGGQGAPLVPYVDYLLFRHPRRTRIALNIGGIANITVIPSAARPEDVLAFDTGPGNMAIDALAREFSRGKLAYDRDGRLAFSGHVDKELLNGLLRDSYYRRRPPKSAGREQYGAEFVARLKATGRPLRDLVATATVLTAAAIAAAVRPYQTSATDLIVSGGGVHNPCIMAHLAALLPDIAISTSTDHGIDADAKEAIAFAILAWQTWRRRPGNLPSATGARRAVVLGNLTP